MSSSTMQLCWFQHCAGPSVIVVDSQNPKIFVAKHHDLVDICPVCRNPLPSDTVVRDVPCSLSSCAPLTVVLKPTGGSFYDSYAPGDDLHIGIVDSKGIPWSFDHRGVVRELPTLWTDCLCIVRDLDVGADALVRRLARDDVFRRERYNEHSHNCFTFVLSVLRELQPANVNPDALADKEAFASLLVQPRLMFVHKYMHVLGCVGRDGYLVVNQT